MDKKKDEVDYAAAYRQFMNFGHGRSLKQFCEDEDYIVIDDIVCLHIFTIVDGIGFIRFK